MRVFAHWGSDVLAEINRVRVPQHLLLLLLLLVLRRGRGRCGDARVAGLRHGLHTLGEDGSDAGDPGVEVHHIPAPPQATARIRSQVDRSPDEAGVVA